MVHTHTNGKVGQMGRKKKKEEVNVFNYGDKVVGEEKGKRLKIVL